MTGPGADGQTLRPVSADAAGQDRDARPRAPGASADTAVADSVVADSVLAKHAPKHFARLHTRPEFLAAAKGPRFHAKAFSLQAAPRIDVVTPEPRFGLTVTRKAGNSVERNRMRRRLREALRLNPDLPASPGHDYVIVARRESLGLPFPKLVADLRRAIGSIFDERPRNGRSSHRNGRKGPSGSQ